MGSSPKTPKAPKLPPEPEPVKYTEAEMAKSRGDAKRAAARRYGISGTNITRGQLGTQDASTKKRTLGGE